MKANPTFARRGNHSWRIGPYQARGRLVPEDGLHLIIVNNGSRYPRTPTHSEHIMRRNVLCNGNDERDLSGYSLFDGGSSEGGCYIDRSCIRLELFLSLQL